MIVNIIFGGAGFIGINLSISLLNKGQRVLCFDNYVTGSINHCKYLKQKFKNLYNYYTLDITNARILSNIDWSVIGNDTPRIFNLACPASPVHYQVDPMFTFNTSVIGVNNLCGLVESLHNCKLVHTSTSEIYGNPLEHPQEETYNGNVNTMGPRSCYDEGKRAAETIIYMHQNKNLKIARLFNTYGPYMDPNDGRFVSNFIMNCLQNKPIPIHGNGLQTRSICYVDNTVEGLIALMDSDIQGPVNIGNPDEKTVLEWAEIIYKECNGKDFQNALQYIDADKDDPVKRCPDITLAKDKLGWYPKIDNMEGIKKTIKYFESII